VVYKIYEIIRDQMGGDQRIVQAGWVTRAALSDFTGSVNNPNVMGEYARHGVSPCAAPRRPMSVPDAEQFTQGLLTRWCLWNYAEAVRHGII